MLVESDATSETQTLHANIKGLVCMFHSVRGSARLWRAGCGVAPQTSSRSLFCAGATLCKFRWHEADGGTPSAARETRALPNAAEISVLGPISLVLLISR
jgi:hypothetical protein